MGPLETRTIGDFLPIRRRQGTTEADVAPWSSVFRPDVTTVVRRTWCAGRSAEADRAHCHDLHRLLRVSTRIVSIPIPVSVGLLSMSSPAVPELTTERLRLRAWRESDRAPFAALNADPIVMEHFPSILTREESDALIDRIRAHFTKHGFGLWALEAPQIAGFLGYAGLSIPAFEAAFTPCVEIGWRLAREHWGCGYATEAAIEVLRFGFRVLALDEIVSFTTPGNARSQRVMERIGMQRDPAGNFDHPRLPDGHPLQPHILYRVQRANWTLKG
jgi:RimJ/RimL family protein N-acetyltransferase